MNPKKRLGEMLIEAGIIDETQLKAALGYQRQWGIRLGQAFVDLKLATEPDVVRALSVKFGFPIAQLADLVPSALEQAVKLLPRDFAVRNNVFPMAADTATLTVAMSDPTNLALVDEIRFRTGRRVKVCIGGDREVAEAVRRRYPQGDVEAIALDLDVDEGQSETVTDPFGGGSKTALDAFFGQQAGASTKHPVAPGEAIAPPPAPAAAGPSPQGDGHPRVTPPPSAPATATAAAAASPRVVAAPSKAPAPPAVPAPRPVPARAASPLAPSPRPAGSAPAAPVAIAPASQRRAPPAPAPAAVRRPAELELEEPPAEGRGDAPAAMPASFDVAFGESFEEMPSGEPILATELASDGEVPGAQAPRSQPLTPGEIAILDALARLAGGHHAEPDILKPAQAMAALVRLLLDKGIISDREFLDALGKK